MAFNLVKNQQFTQKIRTVYYFSGMGKSNLDFHNQLRDIDVIYCDGLPTPTFFQNIKPNSIGLFHLKKKIK